MSSDRHTSTDDRSSRQKQGRPASFWPIAAVSSWQLANALTFASDNPGPEPDCLSLSFSPLPSSHLSYLSLGPVVFLFRTFGLNCFPPGFKSRGGNLVGCVNGGTGCAPQQPSVATHTQTQTHQLVASTHAHTQYILLTCKHPPGEQCFFNQDLNICPLTGCLSWTKLD